MIVHFYIETTSDNNQSRLERVLNMNGYPFYDAGLVEEQTLEEIETKSEDK